MTEPNDPDTCPSPHTDEDRTTPLRASPGCRAPSLASFCHPLPLSSLWESLSRNKRLHVMSQAWQTLAVPVSGPCLSTCLPRIPLGSPAELLGGGPVPPYWPHGHPPSRMSYMDPVFVPAQQGQFVSRRALVTMGLSEPDNFGFSYFPR